jgi:hypothetical protein
MKNYQTRLKFFFVPPNLFQYWPYPSRLAIGINLNDAWFKDRDKYRFEVKGQMYEINRDKAIELGNRYNMGVGIMPNIIPLSEFKRVQTTKQSKNEKAWAKFNSLSPEQQYKYRFNN